MAKKRIFTEEETIRRIWDIEDIKSLMSRRVYYMTNGMRAEETAQLWVREPKHRDSASFGSNWGFYTGMDSIERFYVDRYEKERKQRLLRYRNAYPELGLSETDYDVGSCSFRCINTPYVVVADDGKTARGRWYLTGQDTKCEPHGGATAYWWCWVIGADFVLEDGEWKLWHLVEAQDFYCPVGKPFKDEPAFHAPGEDPGEVEFGKPDISILAHDNKYLLNDNWPPVPMPYATFSDETSYGPEGHPGLNDEIFNLEWATEVASKKAWGR